ncbi:hypothetical protein K438DRAFT_1756737 [Mycena galopus ATCC 62051]|nr:hypothetical protein K438DRAFT_1756737 [Mycena galopus ATCC 62051]
MSENSSTLQSSLLFFALSLIPSNILRYIALGVTLISLLLYSMHHNPPAARLTRLYNTIAMVEDILMHTKAKCRHNYFLLAEYEIRLMRFALMHNSSPTLLKSRITTRSLTMCERELQDIHTSLLLFIEAAHQRKLTEDINGSEEIAGAVPRAQHSRLPWAHERVSAPAQSLLKPELKSNLWFCLA